MTDDPFNLLTEPWIPVRPLGAPGVRLVGIKEALLQARTFAGVEDASPLQTVAMYRLLLAVLHRALMGPASVQEARDLFRNGFPADKLSAYFQRSESRFELFGPEPFMQVPDLPVEGFAQSWERLGAEVGGGNTTVLFNASRRAQYAPPALDAAEAARRLLEHQTFALGGLTRKFTAAAAGAPSATSALVMARGANLHETLCLNLVEYTRNTDKDMPPWEASPLSVAEVQGFYPNGGKEKLPQPVQGVVQGYAWQGRSIRLAREDDGRVRFIAYAEGVPPNLVASWRDPMVAIRPLKDGTLYPLKLSAERLFWRDFESILPDRGREVTVTDDGKAKVTSGKPPQVLEHALALSMLMRERRGKPIPLVVFGQVNDQGKIELWRSESYELPTSVSDDEDLYQHVPGALSDAKDTRDALNHALRGLAGRLLSAGERDPHKDDVTRLARSFGAEQQYWSDLADPFQAFLLQLGDHPAEALAQWRAALKRTAQGAWDVAKQAAGEGARAMRAKYESEGFLMKHLHDLTGGQRDRADQQTP